MNDLERKAYFDDDHIRKILFHISPQRIVHIVTVARNMAYGSLTKDIHSIGPLAVYLKKTDQRISLKNYVGTRYIADIYLPNNKHKELRFILMDPLLMLPHTPFEYQNTAIQSSTKLVY